ncbi:LysR family transcriptional regulator [Kineosporia succinea]|uniref:DNA-binding transcriptional LysR family regulator n=1 Tax=Kineosporia succinea TaxID=84632 RepID=A0ABT9PDP8_9ACTN|nr:LysR family transcriptional regulator [Kineosporia succinea]MDP9830611.1 DNA-binding transcriptional LysR family regulator [Kineosporia succinea]
MAELDLALVAAFVVLARHRHFGRAAADLHVTQPSLTRQIARLERRIGTPLIERTNRGNDLTEAGAVFLPRAQALLRDADEAVRAARAAARPGRLVVGHSENLFVTAAVRELVHADPAADVTTRVLPCPDSLRALLAHEVDVLLLRLHTPVSDENLRLTTLYEEQPLLVIPVGHRFEGKESITLDDLTGEPLVRLHASGRTGNDIVRERVGAAGPSAAALGDKYELAASGRGAFICSGPYATGIRPDLTTVPIDGVPPGRVVVASRGGDANGLVTAFHTAAQKRLVA